MTTMLNEIDAATVKGWLDADRAILIDIRENDEFAREHIPGAHLVPLSGFDAADFPKDSDKIAVFHCASGNRTCEAAPQILALEFDEVYQLTGGLAGWKKAGHATRVNRKAPISIMRQVQIAAGTLVLLGFVLGWLVSPGFYGLSAFVGAGLAFAGISGTCAMATLLGMLPHNRRALDIPAPAAQRS